MPESAYAPGRVELLGNHTDYNQGVVLAAAIDRGLTVSGTARADDTVILNSNGRVEVSLSELRPQSDQRWANYPLGVVQQLQRAGHEIRGFEATISGDIPAGAGLSSSAALEVATAGFLMKLHNLQIDPLEVAKLCRRAENEFVGVQSGLLDQVTSVFGRADHLVYLDCQTEEIRTLPFPEGFALVIADTGVKHSLAPEQIQHAPRRMRGGGESARSGKPARGRSAEIGSGARLRSIPYFIGAQLTLWVRTTGSGVRSMR